MRHSITIGHSANEEVVWTCSCGETGRYRAPHWEHQEGQWLRHIPPDEIEGVNWSY